MLRKLSLLVLASGCLATGLASAGTLQDVLNRGTLRVGVALAEPWAMRDDAGELYGFEIDVARKLADDLEVDVRFVRYDQDALIRGLQAGEIDLIASGFAITAERLRHVNFSNPYATFGIGMATNLEATAEVERLEQLNAPEFSIAVRTNSAAETLAERIMGNAQIVDFLDDAAAVEALIRGEVHVYLDQEPIPSFLELEYPQLIDVPLSEPLVKTPAAFAVGKGDPDFLAYLDSWILMREADTWLPTTYQYWFRSLRWRD